jgi:protein-S-isoprenylcysteine O-methyltransferase Ste14
VITGKEEKIMETEEKTPKMAKALLWAGIVTLLVGLKLIFSYIVPGLKTPGELLLSGGLLLVCTVQLFKIRAGLSK